MLAWLLATSKVAGTVAAVGLAADMKLNTTVAPFILRGVTLAGIDSVMRPKADREHAWRRLARDLDMAKLDSLTVTATLEDIPDLGAAIIAGKVRGRVLVDVNG